MSMYIYIYVYDREKREGLVWRSTLFAFLDMSCHVKVSYA